MDKPDSEFGASANQQLRSKLRTFYFQEYCDVQPFIGIDVVLMPKVLELVTKTEVCMLKDDGQIGSGKYLNCVYPLVRNCHIPELFSFPSPESKAEELEAKIAALEAEDTNCEIQI